MDDVDQMRAWNSETIEDLYVAYDPRTNSYYAAINVGDTEWYEDL